MLNTKRLTAWGLGLVLAAMSGGTVFAQDGYPRHDRDRDDHYYDYGRDYDRDYDRGGYGRGYDRGYGFSREGQRAAREIGLDDGARVAQQDYYHRKPYNPYPRGKYSHADHGYHHVYGDKYAYRDQYARAYQQGYVRAFPRY
jgi:hypothetical protein